VGEERRRTIEDPLVDLLTERPSHAGHRIAGPTNLVGFPTETFSSLAHTRYRGVRPVTPVAQR
jgi:hypothetical protein